MRQKSEVEEQSDEIPRSGNGRRKLEDGYRTLDLELRSSVLGLRTSDFGLPTDHIIFIKFYPVFVKNEEFLMNVNFSETDQTIRLIYGQLYPTIISGTGLF